MRVVRYTVPEPLTLMPNVRVRWCSRAFGLYFMDHVPVPIFLNTTPRFTLVGRTLAPVPETLASSFGFAVAGRPEAVVAVMTRVYRCPTLTWDTGPPCAHGNPVTRTVAFDGATTGFAAMSQDAVAVLVRLDTLSVAVAV